MRAAAWFRHDTLSNGTWFGPAGGSGSTLRASHSRRALQQVSVSPWSFAVSMPCTNWARVIFAPSYSGASRDSGCISRRTIVFRGAAGAPS